MAFPYQLEKFMQEIGTTVSDHHRVREALFNLRGMEPSEQNNLAIKGGDTYVGMTICEFAKTVEEADFETFGKQQISADPLAEVVEFIRRRDQANIAVEVWGGVVKHVAVAIMMFRDLDGDDYGTSGIRTEDGLLISDVTSRLPLTEKVDRRVARNLTAADNAALLTVTSMEFEFNEWPGSWYMGSFISDEAINALFEQDWRFRIEHLQQTEFK